MHFSGLLSAVLGAPEIILMIVVFPLYFLPAIVGRNKRNAISIALLNFLLGWTLIGWVGALIWALTKDNVPPAQFGSPITAPSYSKSNPELLLEYKQLLDNGAITQSEYDSKKQKLLNSDV
ncbi:superinfection immunity protein [Mucilaginibacter sp. Bleaf8]|uniref:superinfection immunity protein n=1 Tax=Mucilaginibacter sp. Bleaf8 TaxID=2834430 RepID=UPI001BCEBBBC|nr:superinfection immunity protein [Mucilaginibacter sp. Bleaf8]MBS7564180.1 superinfection immunity protein [Mucilaginibacter sp. Bleaf8]